MAGTFLPLIKDGLEAEFLSIWEDWFVLSDTVDQTKKPGLLKSKSKNFRFKLIRLCSRMGNKKWCIYCTWQQTLPVRRC